MDALIWLRKRVTPAVTALGLRPAARAVYQRLYRSRYGPSQLVGVNRSGRVWRLIPSIALHSEEYEPETVAWLRRTLTPGDTFLDIGGHVGLVAMEGAELVGPAGRVITVEPIPANQRVIVRHAEANGLAARITLVAAACTAEHGGQVELIYDDSHENWSGATVAEHVHLKGTESRVGVPTVSVDGLLAESSAHPRGIKIDVEGAELQVIRGATRTLAEVRPAVWLAFHPHAFPDPKAATEELFALFTAAGYLLPPAGEDGALAFGEHEFRAI